MSVQCRGFFKTLICAPFARRELFQIYPPTFISWLISLFTGCAGFLLRLFSGGLPFSISGIL